MNFSFQSRRIQLLLLLILIISVSIGVAFITNNTSDADNTVTVEFISEGSSTATVDAETAVTDSERRQGLSNTESLSDGKGMLFIYESELDRIFVMRDMNYGLDIIFVGDDCSVNQISHAEQPQDGETGIEPIHQYNSTAKYVLEVPYMYTDGRLSEGDQLQFNESVTESQCPEP